MPRRNMTRGRRFKVSPALKIMAQTALARGSATGAWADDASAMVAADFIVRNTGRTLRRTVVRAMVRAL